MAAKAAPGTAKNVNAVTSEAAQAARRRERAQERKANVFTIPLLRDYTPPARISRSSEIERPDVPVHQPPDHEDDQDQAEHGTDPNRPALTVIAAAVVPEPASEENHEQQDDQN
jgi:hypothetical protein